MVALLVAMIAHEILHRYYRDKFGKVRRTFTQRLPEIVVGFSSAVISLAAFAIDPLLAHLFSPLGLVIALIVLLEFLRTTRPVRGRYLSYMPIISVFLLVLSVLPMIGLTSWWLALHLASQTTAILAVVGIITILNGLFSHFTLVRLFKQSAVTYESIV